ncbi:MAG: enolase C-terminal domain-like protein [Steroidobacteraceae bacterium]|jgi:L-alanine-DL-glutamate epimerase-like enolase superfamily enzyme
MKIDDVALTLFRWDGIPPVVYGPNIRMPGGPSTLGLLAISTDDGATGHSFLGGATRGAELEGRALIETLKPLLMAQNPLDRERLNQRMWGRGRLTMVRAIGAVDVALWDLAGKIAGLPVHQLLGSYRDSIPAYASSQALGSPEEYCEQALYYKSRGWQAYKIHPPHPWADDIKVCTEVRNAVGEGYPLMLDATWSYDYPTAVRVGRAIQDLGFHWFEDPLTEWNIHGYQKLRQQLHVPLMATELPFAGLDQYAPWLLGQATDFLRGDVCFKGGITTCVKAAHLAEAFGMNFEIHHGSNSLNNVACLHIAMAIRNCEYFEVLLPDAANKFGLVEDIEVDSQGLVHAPMGPGLGVEIDFDCIKRNTQEVLR